MPSTDRERTNARQRRNYARRTATAEGRAAQQERERKYAATEAGKAARKRAVDKRHAAAYARLAALKEAAPCTDCGQHFPAVCMDYDHIKGDKLGHVAALVRGAWSRVEAEIAKCELVCSNCHRLRTQKRRQDV